MFIKKWHKIGESDCLIKTQEPAKFLMMYRFWHLPSVGSLNGYVF